VQIQPTLSTTSTLKSNVTPIAHSPISSQTQILSKFLLENILDHVSESRRKPSPILSAQENREAITTKLLTNTERMTHPIKRKASQGKILLPRSNRRRIVQSDSGDSGAIEFNRSASIMERNTSNLNHNDDNLIMQTIQEDISSIKTTQITMLNDIQSLSLFLNKISQTWRFIIINKQINQKRKSVTSKS
jgi:hypothetical protein